MVERSQNFADGFSAGLYARLELSDVPEKFSMYYFQYPESIKALETALINADEKHLRAIDRENKEVGGDKLYREEMHSLIKRYEKNNSFEEKRDWICGFWTGVVVRNYFQQTQKHD